MFTKPQDIIVAIKMALTAASPTYAELGQSLGMSASEAHAAMRRLVDARLADPDTHQIRRQALRDFLVHGVPYVFPAQPREMTRGMPTAWAAPVLSAAFAAAGQVAPVWPDPDGNTQGASVRPLYPSAPGAARRDPVLYDFLALVDALRIGRARERSLAEKEISERLLNRAAA
jgi:hypothetical protein